MIWLLSAWAAASELVLTSGDHLQPGVPARLEHAAPGARSVTLTGPPGTAIRTLPRRGDVWAWEILPPASESSVEVVLGEDGRTEHSWLQIAPPPESALVAPARVDAVAGGPPVRFLVSGVTDPAQLAAFASDGTVELLPGPAAGQVEAVVTPEAGSAVRPVVVGLRRADLDQRPIFVVVRLHARRHLPFSTEPGARLDLAVGGRTYGPFFADSHGAVDAVIEQYPGDARATATLADDLGNVTRSEVTLGTAGTATFAIGAAGQLVTGGAAPPLWVRAVHDDGAPVVETPGCVATTGPLTLREVERGTWLAVGSADRPLLDDLRVECSVAGSPPADVRLRASAGPPATLDLRVWPAEMRTDQPSAEIRATLEDATGGRVPVDGLVITAARGTVRAHGAPDALVAEAEYDGTAATDAGSDVVTAAWRPAPTRDGVDRLRLAWGAVPLLGSVEAWVQVLDPAGRPVEGVPVALDAGGPAATGETGADGWFHAPVRPTTGGPVVLSARARDRVARAAIVPGDPGFGDPGGALVTATQEVRFSAGRVYGIAIAVDPPVLRAGPGSFAVVSVRVEDRAGQAISDPPPEVEADAGRLGPIALRSDGSWSAEWYPDGIDRPQQVGVHARAAEVASETRLEVAPRSFTAALGAHVGGITNLGDVASPYFGFDLDLRLRSGWLGDAVGVRFGASVYAWTSSTPTGLGAPFRFRSVVVPITTSLVFRREGERVVPWASLGAAAGPHRLEVSVGEDRIARGVDWLVGPQVAAGVALPLGTGEADFGVTGLWLPSDGGELGYAGNVGGLSGDLGYRIRF